MIPKHIAKWHTGRARFLAGRAARTPIDLASRFGLMGFGLALVALLAPTLHAQVVQPAQVVVSQGRPVLQINGRPRIPAAYSPAAFWNRPLAQKQTVRMADNGAIDTFFICFGRDQSDDFWQTPLWNGERVDSAPMGEFLISPDEQARWILERPGSSDSAKVDRDVKLFVRFTPHEPRRWRDLRPEELVVTESGQRLQVPSLASEAYWNDSARFAAAVIEYCESRPWSDRIIGYANFLRSEGTHEPLISHQLFDHSPVMLTRWRAFLKRRYQSVEKLQQAHVDPKVTFETVMVPRDRLRGSTADAASLNYWQNSRENQALRDYLQLVAELFHAGLRHTAQSQQQALDRLGRQRILIYDGLKQVMQGWDLATFFDPQASAPLVLPDVMAGSGHMGVAELLHSPGVHGLVTPHDYQTRGMGGIFEPEGMADSLVLRGQFMFVEMDTRTWTGRDPIAPARDVREFAAITWRNIGTALSRGFTPYWMDLNDDWFSTPELHDIIRQQAQVIKASVDWPHHTPPGIAVIIDDRAALETNGDSRFLQEAVMNEWRISLSRCGVPVRLYVWDDLGLPDFPEHQVFYFPNLFRVDEQRLALLREKVFKPGRVVVWGPGSGISDGQSIDTESATRLTGFTFKLLPGNLPRRTLLSRFDHPITQGLSAGTVLGSSLAFGPVLLPQDGDSLGHAWTKLGRNESGLAVKTMAEGWRSVFLTTVGVPAEMWRNLARWAGAHVYSQENDVLIAGGQFVGLHSLKTGPKRLDLPAGKHRVTDLITGQKVGESMDRIEFELREPGTALYRVEPVAAVVAP